MGQVAAAAPLWKYSKKGEKSTYFLANI